MRTASQTVDRAMEIGMAVLAGTLATHDPAKYVVINSDPFLTPNSESTCEREVEVTLTLTVTVAFDMEEDDDGCGGPSRTGNSMTGRRGKYPVVVGCSVTPEQVAEKLSEAMSALESEVEVKQ